MRRRRPFLANLLLPNQDGPFWYEFNVNGLGRARRDLYSVEPTKGLYLHPHRGRTAFSHDETTYIHLYTAPGFPGGKVTLSTRAIQEPAPKKPTTRPPSSPPPSANPSASNSPPTTPNNTTPTSSPFKPANSPGHYQIQARLSGDWVSQAYKLQITPPASSSDFTAYTYDSFINLNSENAPRHLALLKSANIEFVSNQPRLQSTLPHFESFHYRKMASGFAPAPPAELVVRPLLQRQTPQHPPVLQPQPHRLLPSPPRQHLW